MLKIFQTHFECNQAYSMPRRLTNSTLLLYGVRNLSVMGQRLVVFGSNKPFSISAFTSLVRWSNQRGWRITQSCDLHSDINKKVLWVLNHEVEKRHTFHQKNTRSLMNIFLERCISENYVSLWGESFVPSFLPEIWPLSQLLGNSFLLSLKAGEPFHLNFLIRIPTRRRVPPSNIA